ncbi:hypothetical protein OnM2_022050 [Erysiphe neolycopersici]|uniref:Uncharacterized protein n=1 Tax=Erysiphe neolycopersici TaxID=212602 RepID=A0A420I2R5_9PEZI|nr:hypothetical protein OnM2_022050 [Erysiphe neolycopersici]
MPYGITRFRCTVVKSYYHDNNQPIQENNDIDDDNRSTAEDTRDYDFDPNQLDFQPEIPVKRGGCRPKGSRNQPKLDNISTNFEEIREEENCNNMTNVFLTSKEKADYELAVQLRNKGIISTPGKPFEISDAKEFEGLRSNGVFYIEKYELPI